MLYIAILYACFRGDCAFVTTEPSHYARKAECVEALEEAKEALREAGVIVGGTRLPLNLHSV